ncbi:hypothetical protein TGFOU_402940 [Toxoplasma gondii FOU]|uniref:Uncharacterized protein n=1 Tax=Toxoplasma gondii FOU TaxID=943167 RepID=A0A086LF05_TOXGO|nr:hypothetical protein TGFOU_402940 [Toxoplasma gondii FOU]
MTLEATNTRNLLLQLATRRSSQPRKSCRLCTVFSVTRRDPSLRRRRTPPGPRARLHPPRPLPLFAVSSTSWPNAQLCFCARRAAGRERSAGSAAGDAGDTSAAVSPARRPRLRPRPRPWRPRLQATRIPNSPAPPRETQALQKAATQKKH